LTVPWFLAIVGGRVDIEDGQCQYKASKKLTKCGMFESGISYQPVIRSTAKVMLMTAMTFLVIQVPAFSFDDELKIQSNTTAEAAASLEEITKENKKEATVCIVGGVICVLEFFLYLYWQYQVSQEGDGSEQKQGCMSRMMAKLTGASQLPNRRTEVDFLANKIMEQGIGLYMKRYREKLEQGKLGAGKTYNDKLMTDGKSVDSNFESVMKVFFKKYGNLETQDNMICLSEFTRLVNDLRIDLPQNEIEPRFKSADSSKDGALQFDEFMECFSKLAALPPKEVPSGRFQSQVVKPTKSEAAEEEEEEQEEMPEEFADLSPDVQRQRILFKSCYMMAAGTVLVLIFSDPMVDVLAGIGEKTGVPSFYIAFILAPLASNASELVAAYSYSLKKTSKTITISLSTLEGAACMNNTFCLAIFFGLIYCQGLAWKFTAETISILFVQVVIFGVVMVKDTQTLADGVGILMLLPLSLALVYVLENLCLLD